MFRIPSVYVRVLPGALLSRAGIAPVAALAYPPYQTGDPISSPLSSLPAWNDGNPVLAAAVHPFRRMVSEDACLVPESDDGAFGSEVCIAVGSRLGRSNVVAPAIYTGKEECIRLGFQWRGSNPIVSIWNGEFVVGLRSAKDGMGEADAAVAAVPPGRSPSSRP